MTYDLEERTLAFSKSVLTYCKNLKQDSITRPIISQVVRSSGSVGANYIEANESLSPKDHLLRLKISRKEAKETIFWLKNLKEISENMDPLDALIDEAEQLNRILSSIIHKASSNPSC